MKRTHLVFNLLVLIVFLGSTLLAACTPPWAKATPEPAATDTPAAETLVPTVPSKPAVAVRPLPPAPPTVVSRSPARGEELEVDKPIVLTFDQEMELTSVETAFSIQPAVQGNLVLKDNELIFTPARPWDRGEVYQVNLEESAASTAGLKMNRPVTFRFQTVGYLEVTTVTPADGTRQVGADSMIMVVFNRPVVPLVSVEDQKGLPQPLNIEPPVKGDGAWINTSIYAFRPEESLASATEYRVTLKAGLADVTGGVLEDDFSWSFSTELPKVVYTQPSGKGVRPDQPIEIQFNLPMDRTSVDAAFRLVQKETRAAVRGTFEWWEDSKGVTFTPTRLLEFGMSYEVELGTDARAAAGPGQITVAERWSFDVVGLPRVDRTVPRDGATDWNVYGGVEVWFTAPLDESTIWPNLTILPKPTNVYTYYAEYESRLWISFDREPQTSYTVTLGAKIGDLWGNTLPEDHVIRFRTGDLPPTLYLNTPGFVGTYHTYTETLVTVQHRNITSLTWELYQLSTDDLIKLTGYQSWDYRRGFQPAERDLLIRQTIRLQTETNKTELAKLWLSETEGRSLEAGIYFLTVRAPEISRDDRSWQPPSHILIVSPHHIILKSGSDEALVWVTDMSTGQPVAGLPVRLVDHMGEKLATGVSDTDGLFQARFETRSVWDAMYAFVGERGDRFGVVISEWSQGISPWDFDVSLESYRSTHVGFLYTDRPIYRPGQTVHFKGVVRQDDDARYTLPGDVDEVDVTIWDGEGNEVYRNTLPMSQMGSFWGELELATEAGLGYYHISAQITSQRKDEPYWSFGSDFQVAEYRKPEYEVSVKTDQDEYIQGDRINVAVQASYYFGGPVRNAEIKWSLLSQDYWFIYQGDQWYDFADFSWWEREIYQGRYGEQIASGRGNTDEQGSFVFHVPADIADKKLSQQFTIDVSITDVTDQVVSSRVSTIVHKGEYYIGLRPKHYVMTAGDEAEIQVITVDPQSEPSPDVELQVVAYSTRWDSVRQEDVDGREYWTSKILETPVVTKTIKTDTEGQGLFTFVPEAGGTYRVRATGLDSRENRVRASTDIWVSSRRDEYVSWRIDSSSRIELIADKREYEPGEVATILIPSPYQGEVQALVTLERGNLLETRVIALASNSETIEVPITEAHIPNIYVSVVIFKGVDESEPLGSFRVGYVKLPVVSEAKRISVEITSDKDLYQPRQEATYKIRATDWMGQPVRAEFSLGLIDLSVLALGGAYQGDIFQTFWRERGIGFYTAGTLVVSVDRLTLEATEAERVGAKGGGGGPEGMDGFIRTEFPDTAYWNPSVMTDADGEAVVSVTLPDSLTTWRLDARGLTADTRIGVKAHDVISTLPLMARPVLPRFFVVGDQAHIAGIVHNNTDEEIQTTVRLTLRGLETEDDLQRVVKIPAHDLVRLNWDVRVENVGQVSVRYSAEGGGLSDAVEISLPVYHASAAEIVGTAGQLDSSGRIVESIVLPDEVDPDMGDLTVKVDPSLAAAMRDGLTYLEHFPYECIEQTVSRFLPNVMTYRAITELGIENPDLETKLPQMVGVALQRIYSNQLYNGGWGWFRKDDADDYLTAYVLYGLTEAHKAGFVVERQVMENAARYLRGRLATIRPTSKTTEANREAFKLYVMANYDIAMDAGPKEMSRAVLLFEQREKLGIWGKAILVNTLGLLDAEETTRINTLVADINTAAILSATGAHWEEDQRDFRNMNTDTRSTAIVLSAIARHDPRNGLGPNAVRWLMSARREGRWESTYETAWVLMGLTDWMIASGELKADYRYRVLLNEESLTEGLADTTTLHEQVELQIAVAELLLDRGNLLTFERDVAAGQTGEGRLYYTAHLNYYLPVDRLKALDRGIIVSREYRLADEPDKPISEAQVGDVIQVRLTIIAPNDLHYVVVEDPLPAGCEALDPSLQITSVTIEPPKLEREPDNKTPWWMRWWFGWWSPTHTELRDEKVALFATYMPRGTYQYTYMMRASLPGQFMVIPTTAYEMYFPEVFGRAEGKLFDIRR